MAPPVEGTPAPPLPAHQTLGGHQGAVADVVISAGRALSVGLGDCVHVWRLQTPDGLAAAARPLHHPDRNLVQRSWLTRLDDAAARDAAAVAALDAAVAEDAPPRRLPTIELPAQEEAPTDDGEAVVQWRAPSVDVGEA